MRQRPFTSVFAIFLILATSTGPALGYYNRRLGRFMQRDVGLRPRARLYLSDTSSPSGSKTTLTLDRIFFGLRTNSR